MHEERDSYKHQGMRKRLVGELKELGISDQRVLDAFEKVPRHLFLDTAFLEIAYENRAFPIGSGQTISHPYTVAFQTQLLEIQPGDRILEIGTGSGFQTAILIEMGAKVVSIERHKALHKKSKQLLNSLGIRALLILGDGYKGSPADAPFDSIIVTCGAPEIPKDLLQQIKPGGKLIVPIGKGDNQRMMRIVENHGSYNAEDLGAFSFVPMLPEISRKSI